MKSQRRREIVTLVIVFVGVLLVSALAVYFIGNRGAKPEYTQVQQPGQVEREPSARPTVTPSPGENESFVDQLMGSRYGEVYGRGERWAQTMGRIALRLLLATLLGGALAYRPRRKILTLKRNPYVSQADPAGHSSRGANDHRGRQRGAGVRNLRRRFAGSLSHEHSRPEGDHGAADQSRARTRLRRRTLGSRNHTGAVLAAGAWILEWREPELVFRSMELKVRTKNVVSTQRALRELFRKHGFDKELRAVDREASEDSPGSIVYSVDVSPTISTDELSADILALDGQNVDGIEWNQKKSYSYLYQ